MNSFEFIVNDEAVYTNVTKTRSGWRVCAGDIEYDVTRIDEESYRVQAPDGAFSVVAVRANDRFLVDIDGTVIELGERAEGENSAGSFSHHSERDKVFAPMPGKVVKINVGIGDKVTERQTLVVVEAMKMENPVLAAASGKVKAIHFSEGEQVDIEQAIIELELCD